MNRRSFLRRLGSTATFFLLLSKTQKAFAFIGTRSRRARRAVNSYKLWVWGNNTNGALGLGDTATRSDPTLVSNAANITSASMGQSSFLLKNDGLTMGAGANSVGSLGNNTSIVENSFVTTPPGFTGVAQIGGSSLTRAAIKIDGSLWTWGKGMQGVLGTGNTVNCSSPMQVSSLTAWKQVSIGDTGAAGIKVDGTLWCWGTGASGANGNGGVANISTPVQLGANTDWKKVSRVTGFGMAIKEDGSLWSWGLNSEGQLGTGDLVNRSSPVRIGTDTTWLDISVGMDFVLALKTDRSLWSCGKNTYGQLGHNHSTTLSTLTQIGTETNWSKVSCGLSYSLALKTNGSLWGWGINDGNSQCAQVLQKISTPVQVGSETSWEFLAAADWSASYLGIRGGTLYTWGISSSHNLGFPTNDYLYEPTQVNGNSYVSGAITSSNMLVIDNSGNLWGVGGNSTYTLGLGDQVTRSTLVMITGHTGWTSVCLGEQSFGIGLKNDGTLWGWGIGGLNGATSAGASIPTQISGTNWTQIASGSTNTFGIRDGKLFAWGSGFRGSLGLGVSGGSSSTPTQIGTFSNWSAVFASADCGFAIRAGALYAWGDNSNGRLGLGNTTHRSSPFLVGSSWAFIGAGRYHTVGVKTNGTLWAWGLNDEYQLGLGHNNTPVLTPVQVGTDTTWALTGIGPDSSVIKKIDGTLWGFGKPNSLGLSQTDDRILSPTQIGLAMDWADVYATPDGSSSGARKN